MSVPLTLPEQKKQNWFKPNIQIGLYIGYSDYEEVTIKQNGNSKAKLIWFESLSWVKDNVRNFKKCMQKYMIKEATCLIDASPKEVEKELIGIGKTLLKAKKAKPAEKVLAVLLFAGYGVQSAGY